MVAHSSAYLFIIHNNSFYDLSPVGVGRRAILNAGDILVDVGRSSLRVVARSVCCEMFVIRRLVPQAGVCLTWKHVR